MMPRHVTEWYCPGLCGVTMRLEDMPSVYQGHERVPYETFCCVCRDDMERSQADAMDCTRTLAARGALLGRLFARCRRWAEVACRGAHDLWHRYLAVLGRRHCDACGGLTRQRLGDFPRPMSHARTVRVSQAHPSRTLEGVEAVHRLGE